MTGAASPPAVRPRPRQARRFKEQTLQEDFRSYLPRNNSARVFRRREAQYCFQSRVNKVCDAAAAERGPRRAPKAPAGDPAGPRALSNDRRYRIWSSTGREIECCSRPPPGRPRRCCCRCCGLRPGCADAADAEVLRLLSFSGSGETRARSKRKKGRTRREEEEEEKKERREKKKE